MQIQLESANPNAVQSYGDDQITCNGLLYNKSIVLCDRGILTDWPIESIQDLENNPLDILKQGLGQKPAVIVIGHQELNQMPPINSRILLAQEGIGLETMSIGAACRTYNVLLSEDRAVVLGIIFKHSIA